MKNKLLVIALVLFGLIHLSLYFTFQPDDTFIYLVYIKNLLQGHGLSFNGEYVEGFSSVLWVYLNALFAWLPTDYLVISKFISGGFYFLIPYLMFKILLIITENKVSKTNILILLSTYFLYPPLAIWAMAGLETMLYSFWLLFCLYYYFTIRSIHKSSSNQEFKIIGILFGVLATIRPEAFALVGIVFLYEMYLFFKTKRMDYKFYTNFFIAYFIAITILLLWRYSLYGEFLPITAIAKTGNLSHQIVVGLGYIKGFFSDWWPLVLLYVFALLKLFFTKNTLVHSWNIISFITVTGYTLFIIASGADWMQSYRFFIPIIPIAFITIYLSLVENKVMIFIVLLPLIAFFTEKNIPLYKNIQQDISATYGDILIGKYLKNLHLDSNEYIAVVDAGAIPYYADNKTIDMVGLNNKHIAHLAGTFMQKYDNDFVLKNRPIYIQIHVQTLKDKITNMPDFIGSSRLYYSKEFHQNYIYDSNSTVGGLFVRRDTPLTNTFIDKYYDYNIENLDVKNHKLHFVLHKMGEDVWLKPPHPHALGSIYINVKIKNTQNHILFEALVPISENMVVKDTTAFDITLPKLDSNKYFIEIQPVHMGIVNFEKISVHDLTL
ncbi:MAG: hypothetical protein WC656_10595 [Sulfurimonas sp.]|jgi:hypothetical protein